MAATSPFDPATLARLRRGTLLLALLRGPSHGYDLIRVLDQEWGLVVPERVVYRMLDSLAREGLVKPSWVTPDAGPARRVFEVTDTGAEEAIATVTMVGEMIGFARGWVAEACRVLRGVEQESTPRRRRRGRSR